MVSEYLVNEIIQGLKNKGMSERDAVIEGRRTAQGLGAVAKRKKEQEEAQKAASGEIPEVVPKPAVVPPPVDAAPAKPTKGVPQMPKEELDALRIQEQKNFEKRRKEKEGAK